MKHLKKKVKNLTILDLKLMHAGMLFLTFFILLLIPQLMNWLHNQNKWIILAIAIILFIKPCKKVWKQ